MGRRARPREWWIALWGDGSADVCKRKRDVLVHHGGGTFRFPFPVPIKVREVLPKKQQPKGRRR